MKTQTKGFDELNSKTGEKIKNKTKKSTNITKLENVGAQDEIIDDGDEAKNVVVAKMNDEFDHRWGQF